MKRTPSLSAVSATPWRSVAKLSAPPVSGGGYPAGSALVLFVAASLTDYFDGMIARRDKLVTNFGILMDPLVDKIMICSAFIAFVDLDRIPAWMAVVIVARELAITGLRLLAASKQVVLAADACGKAKTISQIVLHFSTRCRVLPSNSFRVSSTFTLFPL